MSHWHPNYNFINLLLSFKTLRDLKSERALVLYALGLPNFGKNREGILYLGLELNPPCFCPTDMEICASPSVSSVALKKVVRQSGLSGEREPLLIFNREFKTHE